MTTYSKILLENSANIGCKDFLGWLIDVDYYREDEGRTTIKKLAANFKAEPVSSPRKIRNLFLVVFSSYPWVVNF
jgi:hypothetical protein